jgi:hypothetical protein
MVFTFDVSVRHVVAIMKLVSKANKRVTHMVYSSTFEAANINLIQT